MTNGWECWGIGTSTAKMTTTTTKDKIYSCSTEPSFVGGEKQDILVYLFLIIWTVDF